MIEGPCEHCGSPDRRKQCRYTWWLPYREDWKKSGADRPCDSDEYEESMRREQRRFMARIIPILIFLAGLILLGLLGY